MGRRLQSLRYLCQELVLSLRRLLSEELRRLHWAALEPSQGFLPRRDVRDPAGMQPPHLQAHRAPANQHDLTPNLAARLRLVCTLDSADVESRKIAIWDGNGILHMRQDEYAD